MLFALAKADIVLESNQLRRRRKDVGRSSKGVVGAAVVDHDDLIGRTPLQLERFETSTQEVAAVPVDDRTATVMRGAPRSIEGVRD